LTRRVETVAVVGRDATLWLAAVALQRSLGAAGVRVQAVELPSWLNPVDCYSTLPSLASMHRLLGIDETKMLEAASGVPVAAQRFSNWAKGAAPFFIPYDDEPPPSGDLPFSQYWLKGHKEGLRVGLEDFSLGCACAKLGRVPVAGGEAGELSASYGYNLDASVYAEVLKQLAIKRGIVATSGKIADVALDGERIRSLELDDGTRIEADLFIDASGAERVLMMRMPGAKFERWKDQFRCDRIVTASAPRLKSLPAFSQVSAFRGGWIGLYPLRDRTAVMAVYASNVVSDQSIPGELPLLARMPVSGEAVVAELKPGMLDRSWIGNCVAVGDAAVAVEPLDASQLHVAQGCISHLIAIFPATADEMPEALAYNKTMHSFAANIRDFTLAHYVLNRRFDERFWDEAREAAVPPTLRRKLDLFAARGAIVLGDDETFSEQSWTLSLLGAGIEPDGYDPRIDLLPDEPHIEKVQQRLRAVSQLARAMPTVDQFVGGAEQLQAAGVL
jgi:tryptophan halogenase